MYHHNKNNHQYKITFIGENPYKEKSRPFAIPDDYDFKVISLINLSAWNHRLNRLPSIFQLLGENKTKFNITTAETLDKNILQQKMMGNYNEIRNWPHKNALVSLKNGKEFIVIFDKKALK